MPKILLAGQDLNLLSTRASVLKKTGADVICCGADDALQRLDSETPDLVVLCHSLPEDKAEMIADKAHNRDGKIRVLMVVSSASPEVGGLSHKFDAASLSEPAKLISCALQQLEGSTCSCNV
jgi:CheY-like chemotaxis protein